MPTPTFAPSVVNPFNLSGLNSDDTGGYSTPAFFDIENDGDLDIVSGSNYGDFYFFLNSGTPTNPVFSSSPAKNPFGIKPPEELNGFTTLTFFDLDGDNDLDLISGTYSQFGPYWYENTSSDGNIRFADPKELDFLKLPTEAGKVISFLNLEVDAAPTFADIDGNGLPDAFIGAQNGDIYYFQNTTTSPGNPSFADPVKNPFGLSQVPDGNSTPAFADADKDGDLDAFIGDGDGPIYYFENNGGATKPNFVPSGVNGVLNTAGYSTPTFGDLNGDGNLDLFSGDGGGDFYFFQNITGLPYAPAVDAEFRFSILPVENNASPTFANIDGRGVGAIVGDKNGDFIYYPPAGANQDGVPQYGSPLPKS